MNVPRQRTLACLGISCALAIFAACGENRTQAGDPRGVVLAAGGGTILRYSDGEWLAAEIAFPGQILGIAFSDQNTVWAFGSARPQDQSLFVSRDDGRTWRPAPDRLPEPYLEYFRLYPAAENSVWIRDLLFTSRDTAYLDAVHQCGGVCFEQWFPVFTTSDEGATWTVLASQPAPAQPPQPSLPANQVFGVRAGIAEVLRPGSIDQIVAPFAKQPLPPVRVTAFETSADHGWVAGDLQLPGGASTVLLRSTSRNEWVEQDPHIGSGGRIEAMDFRAGRDGLACGQRAGGGAFCSYTSDGGETWTRSVLPPSLKAETVTSVVMTGDTSGLALARTSEGTIVLETNDGGASFEAGGQPPSAESRQLRILAIREPRDAVRRRSSPDRPARAALFDPGRSAARAGTFYNAPCTTYLTAPRAAAPPDAGASAATPCRRSPPTARGRRTRRSRARRPPAVASWRGSRRRSSR